MTEEFVLLEPDDQPGDEWEALDVSDTEADRIARRQDREFDEFRKRIKDTEQFKLQESVFDDATLAAVYKLVQDGYVDAFGGPVSTGKEASVFEALGGQAGERPEPGSAAAGGGPEGVTPDREVAVKVYRINSSNFRQMRDYLEGDPRFEGIANDKKAVVLAWTKKEFANLKRARTAGVRVPEPIAVQRNVLVMELVGHADDRARRLSEVDVENPETAYEVVREYMRRLYRAGLIHGDLSEYNMIIHEGELVVIDMGQAVTVHHPNAGEFLDRDCENVAAFFTRQGTEVDPDDLRAYVTEPEPDEESEPDGEPDPGASSATEAGPESSSDIGEER
ncbi:RIO kinase 1 [Halorubrum alkaliphilum]|uniref:non-specific serine/threonine protein kinase n=1 Tax=Halorubrum alkaliphilum TaxID=261290 RepID=A0A8T4GBJ8_9EURY|nr:serine/threonine-protein kinase Rio1 [Halorubrum alkaliphilum]MBP1921798.1 RIO kinase 1 [Halorubrum alkaliphilum]